MIRQQRTEEEWFMMNLELQKQSGETGDEDSSSKKAQQTVHEIAKVHYYTFFWGL